MRRLVQGVRQDDGVLFHMDGADKNKNDHQDERKTQHGFKGDGPLGFHILRDFFVSHGLFLPGILAPQKGRGVCHPDIRPGAVTDKGHIIGPGVDPPDDIGDSFGNFIG